MGNSRAGYRFFDRSAKKAIPAATSSLAVKTIRQRNSCIGHLPHPHNVFCRLDLVPQVKCLQGLPGIATCGNEVDPSLKAAVERPGECATDFSDRDRSKAIAPGLPSDSFQPPRAS